MVVNDIKSHEGLRRPGVATACFVWNARGDMFLMAERLSGKLGGLWNLPGGHLEWMESPEFGAAREVLEEVGIEVHEPESIGYGYGWDKVEDHCYIVLFHCVQLETHVVTLPTPPEPEKNMPWGWISIDKLPRLTLPPIIRMLPDAVKWVKRSMRGHG